MEIDEHIDALRDQGDLLADAAERAGLDAAVPPCAPWLVKDLLRHTGYIHRWAARHIAECPGDIIDGPSETEILRGGAADPELIAWFRAGHAALVESLAAADPGLECATFMDAPSPLAFWARRQAHETAIHRADAESATGTVPEYLPRFAADGVDELIMGFGRRRKYQPAAGTEGARLHVVATDTGDGWHVDARDGRMYPRRGGSQEPVQAAAAAATAVQPADDAAVAVPAAAGAAAGVCQASGPASGVYLFLWNRIDAARAGVTITGDHNVLDAWQSSVRVRWG